MSTLTTNYNLRLPEKNEDFNLADLTDNLKLIDEALRENRNKTFEEIAGESADNFLKFIESISSTDVNNVENKVAYITITNSVLPAENSSTGYCILCHLPASNTAYPIQIAIPLATTSVYIRTGTGNNWGDWIDKNRGGGNGEIVVATYNSTSTRKITADYVATEADASTALMSAINAAKVGDTVKLLDGTYNLSQNANEIVVDKGISIVGSGFCTILNQSSDDVAGTTKTIFNVKTNNVKIANMMLCSTNVKLPTALIKVFDKDNFILENCFIVDNNLVTAWELLDFNMVSNVGYCRVSNNRFFRAKWWGNEVIKVVGTLKGVVSGNLCSGADGWYMRFETSENNKLLTALNDNEKILI